MTKYTLLYFTSSYFLPDKIVRDGNRGEAEADGNHFVRDQLLPTLRTHQADDQSGKKIHRLEEELRTCFSCSFNTGGDVDRILISGNVGFHVRNVFLEIRLGSHFKHLVGLADFNYSCYWWKNSKQFQKLSRNISTAGLRLLIFWL